MYFFRKFPNRNDIVVFNIPSLEKNIPVDRKKIAVARCIGFPGDTVSFQNGVLRINGNFVSQPSRAIAAYFCADSVKSVIDSLFLKLNITPVSTKIEKKSLYFLSRYDYLESRTYWLLLIFYKKLILIAIIFGSYFLCLEKLHR